MTASLPQSPAAAEPRSPAAGEALGPAVEGKSAAEPGNQPWPACETCGQPLPPPVERCECGDPKVEHHVTSTGRVTYCTHIRPGRQGQCPCKVFTDASGGPS